MENVQTVEPAGNDVAIPEELTIDDVVALSVEKQSREPARPEPANPPEPAQTTEPEPEAAAPEPEMQGEQTPAETESEHDWEKVPATAKFRLRDGTVVTAADLKRDWDEVRQVRQTREKIEADRQAVERATVQSAQYAQYLNNTLPVVVQYAQAMMPKPPEEPQYIDGDYVGNQEKQIAFDKASREYQRKVGELQNLQRAAQYATERKANADKEAFAKHLASEDEKLFEKRPHLRDPVKQKQFADDYLKVAQYIGYRPDEIKPPTDHRIALLAELAIEAFKLRTNPPKPVPVPKPAAAAPVAQPGRRVDGALQARQTRSDVLQSARRKGGFDSVDDALDALLGPTKR